jgi:uncharacterized YccA/Bax inhibitor family protein
MLLPLHEATLKSGPPPTRGRRAVVPSELSHRDRKASLGMTIGDWIALGGLFIALITPLAIIAYKHPKAFSENWVGPIINICLTFMGIAATFWIGRAYQHSQEGFPTIWSIYAPFILGALGIAVTFFLANLPLLLNLEEEVDAQNHNPKTEDEIKEPNDD